MNIDRVCVWAVALVFGHLTSGTAEASVFFSEYVEGSGSNKAIEIFNNSGASVDLSGLSVQVYFNGNTTPGASITLPQALLNDGGSFVLAHGAASDALTAVAGAVNGGLNFNGDDAVALLLGGQLIDVIGQIGFDPGSQWQANGVNTANRTLRRVRSVRAGDALGTDGFDPSVEWIGFPIDTFEGLGHHAVVPEPSALVLVLVGLLWRVGGAVGFRSSRHLNGGWLENTLFR